jgi:hypothetical protein
MAQPYGTKEDPSAFTCDSIRWEGIVAVVPAAMRNVRGSGRFFNRGQRTWPLIAGNSPVAQSCWASASPGDASAAPGSTTLTREFSVSAKNRYGISVAMLRCRLLVQSGDRDQWIARLSLAASEASIAYGWNVKMSVGIEEPCECGDGAAAIAVLPLHIDLVVETKIKQVREAKRYLVSPTDAYPV